MTEKQTNDTVSTEFSGMARYARIRTLIEIGVLTMRARDHLTTDQEATALAKAMQIPGGVAAMTRAIEEYVAPRVEAGEVYEHDVSSPVLITPHPTWRPVHVVHRDGDDVFYRLAEHGRIDQTTVERFLEIVRPVSV